MRLKNTHVLLTALFLVVLHLVQVPSYSLILSRIQGVILDKETKEPLKGVVVTLYVKAPRNEFYDTSKTETDEKGYFLFDQIKPKTYIISCHKSGYADYQPDYKILMMTDPSKYVNVINLNQGEIKHFSIEMEKGGGVLVTLFQKDENGVSPLTDYIGTIGLSESEDIFTVDFLQPDSENEENLIESLIPSDKYNIVIRAISPDRSGHPTYRTQFTVKKNEITIISHTFDFTDITGVNGVVIYNNIPLAFGIVMLHNMEGDIIAEAKTNYDGKYSFRNINPGVYKIVVWYRDTVTRKMAFVSKLVTIEGGISKALNFNIK
jgi:phage-related protein